MNPRKPDAFFKAFPKAAAAAFAVLAMSILAYEMRGFSSVHDLLADFRAFYCAGSAVTHGADAYRAAALSGCERMPAPWGLYGTPSNVVLPAPLPPYALAFFVPFSLLSYQLAAPVWLLTLMCAVLVSARILVRSAALPPAAVAFMLLLPAAVLWLPFGEIAPLALLGAAIAAASLRTSPALAAFGLALLALEPHVAAGAWICAALLVPRMRLPLAIAGAVLAGICVAVHPGALTEYLRDVLPVHALAELPRPSQYSAAWLLYALGVPARAALAAGAASYGASLIAGIAIAARLLRRWNDPAVVVFAPLAAAVVGGTFVHASHIALALPFAALIATRENGAVRTSAAIACGLLAVPWAQTASQQAVALTGAGVAVYLVWTLGRNSAFAVRALFVATASALLMVIVSHYHAGAISRARAFAAPAPARGLASAAWGRYVWNEQSAVTASDWVVKIPAWFALLLLMGSAARAASHKEIEPVVRVRELPAAR